jgi:hypothetical protein
MKARLLRTPGLEATVKQSIETFWPSDLSNHEVTAWLELQQRY